MDSIEAALFDFSTSTPKLLAHHALPFPVSIPKNIDLKSLGQLDTLLGQQFAETVKQLLKKAKLKPESIAAIGSHGQTLYHSPIGEHPFTLQVGDPNIIAAKTGITTVADFRRRDLAHGGQGAPLAPALHAALFKSEKEKRVIVNIGGIANITLLSSPVTGFDTGPGNILMDSWIKLHQKKPYDEDGQWAASGEVKKALLQQLQNDPYFKKSPPKSTGTEYFNLKWLSPHIKNYQPVDVQATLLAFTVETIAQSIPGDTAIYVCGGGAFNSTLLSTLQKRLPSNAVKTTESLGVPPKLVEPLLFAWLAKQTLEKKAGNIPSVTGAKEATVLGGIYLA